MLLFNVIPSTPYLCLPKKPLNFHRKPPNVKHSIRCLSSSSPSSSVSIQSRSTQFDLKTYWTTLIAVINQKLDEAILVRYPENICEAMRYSALAKGGKRAPPVMCVAACELFGGNRLAAFPTACALEMDIAPSMELIRPLLPPNPYIGSLKLDCSRLDDAAIQLFIRPTLYELCLHNCKEFSGKLLSEIGG